MSKARVLLDESSAVDRHFRLKCIPTSMASTNSDDDGKAEAMSNLVLVEDKLASGGVGRVVLEHVVLQLTKSSRAKRFIHVHLETDGSSEKEALHLNYTGDIRGWFTVGNATLLERIYNDIIQAQAGEASSTSSCAVVIDSLSELLQQFSLRDVSTFLARVYQLPTVVVVVSRYNASLHKPTTTLGLRTLAKTLVNVETTASIAAYPLLSVESKRRLPHGMHGMVTLLHKSTHGQATDVIEYFTFEVTAGRRSLLMWTKQRAEQRVSHNATLGSTKTEEDPALGSLLSDLTFNLTVSERDSAARKQVVLPYQHQNHQSTPLFFIDDDDPDWDDDDLDDDLDI
ncbi:hypothetical protein H257_13921 [Aphanomyces astaci]|uniref:Elongator complex protein 5 n=1 Tax=Aphanomyces astaci TaxID=112090 RepID=W4FU91_APHAT|nr:hypothetical protein H257_13921 [Aphanomyces astaci]ETV70531.1 hypothetical protein H257_13921 [Aphanomyces astaci]|eukprot:XP_009839914.1 hypothetical protein H257_13921 [Aphanomyces astaci]